MALVTIYRPSDGFSMTVDQSSPIYTSYTSQGWTTTPPNQTNTQTNTATTQETNTQPQTISSWYLSSWNTTGNGSWQTQPTLTINGTQYKFNTPQEYIDKLNWLKSQGATGNLDTFINQFNSALPEFKSSQTSQTTNTQTGTQSAQQYVYSGTQLDAKANNAAVQTLYQAYFNRPASQEELDNWGDKGGTDTTVKALEDFLKQERATAVQNGVTNLPAIRTIQEIQSGVQPEMNTGANDWQGGMWDLPAELVNSSYFKNLTPEMKSMLELMFVSSKAQTAEDQKRTEEAFNQAKELIDPASKVLLEFGRQAIVDQFSTTKASTEEQLLRSQETLNEIGKLMENASLDQQQELGALARQFEQNIQSLEDQSAEAGLTYSSKRSDLERFIGEQNIDLRQSSERNYSTKLRNLETNKAQAERQTDLIRQAGEAQLREIARGAEQSLGTSEFEKLNLTGLSGSTLASQKTKTGENFAGTIEDQRRQQILQLSEILKNYSNPSQIQELYNT